MRKQKKIWMMLSVVVIGTPLILLDTGCANKEFVVRKGIDRRWVEAGETITAPNLGEKDEVYMLLSGRMVKYYQKR